MAKDPRHERRRIANRVSLCACIVLCCCLTTQAKGDLTAKEARKLITGIPGVSLKTSALQIRALRSIDAATVEATVDISTAFRAEGNSSGQWRVTEFRSGQDQWQSIELIATVLKSEVRANTCDLVAGAKIDSDLNFRRARCLLADLLGVQLPSDDVRIRAVSSMSLPFSSKPSALMEASIAVDFRFRRAPKTSWRVAGIKTGNRNWIDPEPILIALNTEKANRACLDLQLIADALDAYRRQSGSFVESKSTAVLIDFLSPRYLSRVIRVDPWHRPYAYEGTRDHFSLRSLGADGKADTSDDILINSSASVPPTSRSN